MKALVIRAKKHETRQQAEWRYFNAAMLDNKYEPRRVLKAMKNSGNIEAARRWLNGPTKRQRRESTARQRYINNSPEIDKEIKLMVSQPGFTTNDGYN
ncbi:MAG: hypothetical protein GY841_10240 [FCB group bacterium]|nr:hypothetical protein [FCB group bacterium]